MPATICAAGRGSPASRAARMVRAMRIIWARSLRGRLARWANSSVLDKFNLLPSGIIVAQIELLPAQRYAQLGRQLAHGALLLRRKARQGQQFVQPCPAGIEYAGRCFVHVSLPAAGVLERRPLRVPLDLQRVLLGQRQGAVN